MTLCLTGTETSLADLEARLARFSASHLVHEIRIDFLGNGMNEVCDFIRSRKGTNLIVTLRTASHGGAFAGTAAEALRIYQALASCEPAWLDVESWVSESELRGLKANSTRILLSHHELEPLSEDFEERVVLLAKQSCDALKIAVSVDDAADLARLLALRSKLSKPHQLIGMGFAGVLSRARYLHFGSLWCYVGASATTAPGQPDWQLAKAWGLPDSTREPFLAVVGGPQIAHSPGQRVYNALFRERGLPWSYLPAQTARAAETFALLRLLGALGCSVTMPHKESAFVYASRPSPTSARARAANSLRFESTETHCTLTDVDGIREPLRRANVGNDDTMLILGAGGAARAAWLAARELGIPCRIAARDPEKARAFFDSKTEIVAWAERTRSPCAILVNATPVVDSSLWPDEEPLRARIVLDAAMGAGRSRLLERAHAAKLRVVSPMEMWIAQGQAQLKWLTGLEVELRPPDAG